MLDLVFSFQFPGRYAITVLAAALEQAALPGVTLHLPRSRAALLDTVKGSLAAGHRVAVAWSFYSASFGHFAQEQAWLRSQLPGEDVFCFAGGVHATAEPEMTLRAGFDLVAAGEGERTIVELARRLAAGEDPLTTPGTAHLDAARSRMVSNGRAEGLALDDCPPFAPGHALYGPLEITRGCIYACRFCQTPFMSKARFRHRSVENTARWVRAMRASGRRDFRFITPTSLSYGSQDESVNLAAVEELLARVKEAASPDGRVFYGTFPSELRPEHVTAEALAVLKRYVHNDNVIVGGQSGSDRLLAESHRGHDVASVERAVRLCVEGGFVPNVDFIFGLPGEKPEDVEATVKLMRTLTDLGARVHGHTFMPLPGTPWKDAAPGAVDPAVQQELGRLASRMKLYGSWKKQMGVAEEIAERRAESRSR